MTPIRWSPEAVADLESIRDFIARDSLYYAELVVRRLVESVDRLSAFPTSGRIVPEAKRPDLREIIVGSHRLVYRYRHETVEVVTIFRGSRLFPLSLL